MNHLDRENFKDWIASRVDEGDWIAIERHFNEAPFCQHMGLTVSLDEPTRPKCMIGEDMPFHLGGVGQNFTNGAIIAAMFDFVIGLTALSYASQGNFATSNVNIKLLKPVEKGGVYAIAECSREIGRRLFVEAILFNGKKEPCCYATGEIRVAIGEPPLNNRLWTPRQPLQW
jgi:acyl-coenzyme A thioesterase PaaI-like protein